MKTKSKIMNSSRKYGSKKESNGYGLDLKYQGFDFR